MRVGSTPEFFESFWDATLRRQASARTRIPGATRRPHDRPRGPGARRGRARPTPTPTTRAPCTPPTSASSSPATAAYNDVHLYLAESDPQGRRDWIDALDTIESLTPAGRVIAGHQRAGRHDGPEIIEETRQYIRDFDRIVETTSTAPRPLRAGPSRCTPTASTRTHSGSRPRE